MIFALLLIVGCFITFRLIAEMWWEGWGTAILFGPLFGLAFTMLIMLCVYSPFQILSRQIDTTTPAKQPLFSLNIGSRIEGSFVIGCGRINSTDHYFYYVRRGDGNYVRQNNPVERSAIHEMEEGSTNAPCLTWNIFTYKTPKWVGPNFNPPSESEYVFNVPYGTIVQSYKVQ